MKRNDGTKFKVVQCTENVGDNKVRLDGKVKDLVHWATERGVAGLLEGTVRKYLGENKEHHSRDDGEDGTAENPAMAEMATDDDGGDDETGMTATLDDNAEETEVAAAHGKKRINRAPRTMAAKTGKAIERGQQESENRRDKALARSKKGRIRVPSSNAAKNKTNDTLEGYMKAVDTVNTICYFGIF